MAERIGIENILCVCTRCRGHWWSAANRAKCIYCGSTSVHALTTATAQFATAQSATLPVAAGAVTFSNVS
jgi:hypothetical protein